MYFWLPKRISSRYHHFHIFSRRTRRSNDFTNDIRWLAHIYFSFLVLGELELELGWAGLGCFFWLSLIDTTSYTYRIWIVALALVGQHLYSKRAHRASHIEHGGEFCRRHWWSRCILRKEAMQISFHCPFCAGHCDSECRWLCDWVDKAPLQARCDCTVPRKSYASIGRLLDHRRRPESLPRPTTTPLPSARLYPYAFMGDGPSFNTTLGTLSIGALSQCCWT